MPRVDIHAHILPSLDDGPAAMDESVAMARAAAEDGTGVIVATPHQRDVMLSGSMAQVSGLVGQLSGRLADDATHGEPHIRLLAGMENHIEPDLPDWVAQGKALTLNGTRFILSEPPNTAWPPYLDVVLGRLMAMGMVPVIAHAERNAALQRDVAKVRRLIDAGMVIQVTAESFLGAHGPKAERAAVGLLGAGVVHVIASDMHRSSGPRSPALGPALRRVTELAGAETARLLSEINPTAIIENWAPVLLGRRRRWSLGGMLRRAKL